MTANPTLLTMPLAQNGQKNTIPTTQATAGDGLFSQSTGFPAETSLPLGAGGVAPSREDFNGLANLLGGVAFYAQKGWQFQFDAGQAYYAGCIVRDTTDGALYECINDVSAGGSVPSADSTNWQPFGSGGISPEQIPAFNKRDTITTSGTYTAPVTGWYRITIKGGGGGGQTGVTNFSGTGGGEGGTTIAFAKMSAGDTATIVIGAGGVTETNGGDSSVTINSNTYTAGGGYAGNNGGGGGSGTIPGVPGGSNIYYTTNWQPGGQGGGAGGGKANSVITSPSDANGVSGGGGAGGFTNHYSPAFYIGGSGGNGYVWMEYFDTSL